MRFVHSELPLRPGTFGALTTTATTTGDTPDAPASVPPPASDQAPGSTKRSLLSTLVYSLGFTVQRAIGLLLLPVYTSILSPSEYGVLGVLMSVYVGATIVFGLGMETITTRNYFQFAKEPEKQQAFLDSVWRFLIVFPMAAAAVLTLITSATVGEIGTVGPVDIALTLFAAAANAASTTMPLSVLRARQDLRGYLWMTAVLAIGTTGLTVFFVVVLDQGVRGWFLAMLLGNLALLATAARVVPWHRAGRFDRALVRAAVIFSLPLIPHFVSHWALQLADRGVLAALVSPHDLGVYTLAANLSSVLMMLVMALNQGFVPLYARAGAEEGLEDQLAKTVVLQIWLVTVLALGLAAVGPPLVDAMTPPSYAGAAALVPWLALGYGFLGVYFIPMNGATLGAGRRRFAWVATAFCAVVNITWLLVFVPEHGIHAAAVGSAVAYFVLLVLLAAWAHSGENPVTYTWSKIVPVVVLAAAAYSVIDAARPSDSLAAIALGSAVALAYILVSGLVLFRTAVLARVRRPAFE